MPFKANYFGNLNSQRKSVTVEVDEDEIHIDFGDGETLIYSTTNIQISSRVGNTARWITLHDESQLESTDNDEIDALFTQHLHTRNQFVHELESSWKYILSCLLIVVVFSWGFTFHGVPMLAKHVAFTLPPDLHQTLEQETLEVLDDWLFTASQLPIERQNELQEEFQRILKQLNIDKERPYKLLFRHSDIMKANAFALPYGAVVFTDDMVKLAKTDDELMAVLVHEIGHIENRHAMRRAVQSSVLPLVIMAITGDSTTATTVIAALPTILIESGYSQQFEYEADDFAKSYLKEHNLSGKPLADLLARLAQKYPSDTPSFISTHPPTEERISNLLKE